MRKKIIAISAIAIIALVVAAYFFTTGCARTDVYLKDHTISPDGKTMTMKVGVTSSIGYVRKMKRTSGSSNYYFTFYSTFGINSKMGAKDTFEVTLDEDVEEIYFYGGHKGYKLVLRKNVETGEWLGSNNKKNLTLEIIKNKVAEKGEKLSWNDFEEYSSLEVGSGLYILFYEIDENYKLIIGGVPNEDPMYIRLISQQDSEEYIDIRYESVEDFLNKVK